MVKKLTDARRERNKKDRKDQAEYRRWLSKSHPSIGKKKMAVIPLKTAKSIFKKYTELYPVKGKADKRHTSKTKSKTSIWAKNPRRSDYPGVDTKYTTYTKKRKTSKKATKKNKVCKKK